MRNVWTDWAERNVDPGNWWSGSGEQSARATSESGNYRSSNHILEGEGAKLESTPSDFSTVCLPTHSRRRRYRQKQHAGFAAYPTVFDVVFGLSAQHVDRNRVSPFPGVTRRADSCHDHPCCWFGCPESAGIRRRRCVVSAPFAYEEQLFSSTRSLETVAF